MAKEVQYTNNRTSNGFVDVMGIVLIIMACMLTYVSKAIDFDMITAPVEEAAQGTIVGEWINEAKQQELERELANTTTPIQELAKHISDLVGLSKAQTYYIKYAGFMEKFEAQIADFPNTFVIVASLLLLFVFKSIIVLIPASITCMVTGLIFPFKTALLINFIGYGLMIAAKYAWGVRIDEGYISHILKHSKRLYRYIQDEEGGYATGNPLLLFILRLVPTVPLNPIGAMYGHMGYNFWQYMILSMLGISLRVVAFTAMGANIDEPFSREFALPLIVIMFVSGISMVTLSYVLKRHQKQQSKEESEESK